MRRAVVLGAVIAFGALSISVRVILAAAQEPASGQLTVEKLRDNLFILKTAAWTLPEKYKGYDPARTRLRGNIELIFKELK